jgi:calmodulin
MRDNDSEEEIFEAFKIFDKKGNGHISRNDIKNVMKSLHDPLTQDELDDIMKTWDLDKDGYLNFDEFKNMMTQS